MIMTDKETKTLVDKYYEGLTSRKEEIQIAKYLRNNPTMEGFEAERAIFAYFETKKPKQQTIALFGKTNYLRAIAAVFILPLLSITIYLAYQINTSKTDSYAYINGRTITDEKQLLMLVQNNLDKFSDNVDIESQELEPFINANNIIEQQLTLFSEMGN